jgi:lipoprotein-anchoring transpeptidase ErfK/SrfK
MANKRIWRRGLAILAGVVAILEILGYAIDTVSFARKAEGLNAPAAVKSSQEFRSKRNVLASRIKALAPRGVYIAIDTAENKLKVKQEEKTILEAVVSCGSGDILEEPGGRRRWVFDTPHGEFNITSKLVHPTWIKPDWAFIEEGEKPPQKFEERIDNDSLGDYALGFGDGFFIHGTLYTRLLGRNVTHGCVRVGDDDLKKIFDLVPIGAKVFVY